MRARIEAVATSEGRDVSDYATTLGVAILTSRSVGVAQIGDTIAVVGCAGNYRTVEPAPRAEYVNETTFVTDDDALGLLRLNVKPADEVDVVVLSTDGLRFKILANLATGAPFTPFFEDLTTYLRTPESSDIGIRQFLEDLQDQSGDDKSLIATVRVAVDSAGRSDNLSGLIAAPVDISPAQRPSRPVERDSPSQDMAWP